MQKPKSLDVQSRSDSPGRSALDDGMDRVCNKLDQEKKESLKGKLSKSIQRRFIPLKGEKPAELSPGGTPSSSHWPYIKRHARPLSKS